MSSPIAVIARDGKQFTVTEGQALLIRRRDEEQPGATIVFDQVLLLKRGQAVEVGTPTLAGFTVEASVVQFVRTPKVVVFKKKRRKGYRVKNGVRENYLEVKIQKIKSA